MTTSANKNSVKNNQVINDFGQKIGGAHKDRAREAAERLAGVEASALMLQPLSKVAKLPDLRALYLAGVISSDVARLAWYFWSLIGTKPGGSYPLRLQRWADRAAALIGEVSRVLSYGLAEKSQISNFLEVERPAQTWDLFNAEMTAANWPEDEYKRGAYFVGHYWMNPARYSIHTEKASYYTAFDTVADAVAAIRAKVDKNTTKAPQKFSMYKTAGVYYITPKGKAGIKLAEFTDKAEAWAAYGDTEKLGKIYDELRKFPSERRDWNRPRLGEDWRQGRDMSPESFAEVFPFRGVEFGNWVNQTERAACLNEAADALQDLAAVIGIRPEAVALGGSLAWAFGSRGVGKALAHYEHQKKVINLTKKKGNGCVAHEWFHALDNYIMAGRGCWTEMMAVSDCHAYGDTEKSPIFAAAYELKKALKSSDMYTRSRRIDAFRSSPYWATVTEMAARAFEAVIYYKLEAAGMCNDYLVNFKPSDEWNRPECYPYPTKDEAAQLAPLFDAFIAAAFTEAERAPMVEPSAGILPNPPAVVTYDPAQPIESAPFHVQDETPAVAASEPMNAEEDEAPTPADGVQGASYGDSQKSQNPEASDALADLIAVHVQTKQKYPEAVVLFRYSDFYMSYFADAHTVASTLELAESTDNGAPVVAFNAYDLDKFLPKLIRAGLRVCLADHPGYNVPEPPKYKAPTTVEHLDGSGSVAYVDCEKSQNQEQADSTQQPEPSGNGAAYGDSQKSQISINPGEVYKTAKADRYIIILSDDGEKLSTTDAVLGQFSGNIDTSEKDRFLSCLDAGSIIKSDASQLPPVTDVHAWREGLEHGYGKAFEIRTELIYTASDAMTEAEKADTAARMGFSLPLDPLAVLQVSALHKWNASRGNYRNCAALEWLVTQQDEPTAFKMNAGAYPVIFADYARRI